MSVKTAINDVNHRKEKRLGLKGGRAEEFEISKIITNIILPAEVSGLTRVIL